MSATEKDPTALRTIGEVADDLDIATHVLRFWEGKFPEISPQKRRGRRYYRPEDIHIIRQIKILLYEQGLTIKGVQKYFQEHKDLVRKISAGDLPQPANDPFKHDLFGHAITESPQQEDASTAISGDMIMFKKSDIEELREVLQDLQKIKNRLITGTAS